MANNGTGDVNQRCKRLLQCNTYVVGCGSREKSALEVVVMWKVAWPAQDAMQSEWKKGVNVGLTENTETLKMEAVRKSEEIVLQSKLLVVKSRPPFTRYCFIL